MLAEPQLLSRCFQCRVARVTEKTATMASLAPCESKSPWLHALVDAARCCWPALWRMPKQAPHRRCDLAAAAEMRAFGEASYMLAEPQLLSRCFQCRVARVTERTAKDSESGTLKIHVALAPCIPRHRLPVLVNAFASAQASSAHKVSFGCCCRDADIR